MNAYSNFLMVKAVVGLSNTIALDFGRALFGPLGGTVFAFMVALSCFGALNGRAYWLPSVQYVH